MGMQSGPGVRAMLLEAWRLRYLGETGAALAIYRQAAALVLPDSGLGVELAMLVQEMEGVAALQAGAPVAPVGPAGAPPVAPIAASPAGAVLSSAPSPPVSAAGPALAPPPPTGAPWPPSPSSLGTHPLSLAEPQPDWEPDSAARVQQVGVLQGRWSGVSDLAFSPDTGTLAVCGLQRSGLWRVDDGTQLFALNGSVRCLTFHPGGAWLAAGTGDSVRLVQARDGSAVLTVESVRVSQLAFGPDGALLAGISDGIVRLWRAAGGAPGRTLGVACSIAFAPSGGVLAAGAGDEVHLWRLAGGKLLKTLRGHAGLVRSVAFSPDGGLLASASVDGTIRLWQVPDGRPLRTLNKHTAQVTAVAFHPGGELLASGSGDRTVRLWAVEDGTLLATLKGHLHVVEGVAFSGARLASGSYEGVRLWGVR